MRVMEGEELLSHHDGPIFNALFDRMRDSPLPGWVRPIVSDEISVFE
jgi:hypothetical protein